MTVDNGLRPLFRKHLPMVDWQSVETGGTGRGIPDSNGCYRPPANNKLENGGIEFWIEYKAETAVGVVSLRPEQIGWLTRRARYGGRVYIAVRVQHVGGPRRGDPVDSLYLLPGALAPAARAQGLRDPKLAQAALVWHGGPARWDWPAVLAALTAARWPRAHHGVAQRASQRP